MCKGVCVCVCMYIQYCIKVQLATVEGYHVPSIYLRHIPVYITYTDIKHIWIHIQ